MRVWPGQHYPLGATWNGTGVNFALFSENATRVELCLFDSPGSTVETERIPLPERTNGVWHGYLPDIAPGQLYGYRVHGPYDPTHRHRFNASKLLFDPYARAVGRDIRWDESLHGYTVGDKHRDLSFDERDSAPFAPLGMVVDTAFTWGDDRPPRTPWHKTVIYETHVKGFTQQMPGVPERMRGTYAGLACESALHHLVELGITAVELMPIHYHIDEAFLVHQGKTNYWGYNTLGFFAPDPRYCASRSSYFAVAEFKSMVRTLHLAGLEVILDVVYNHTAEGSELGPTLSLRGIDNSAYYRLSPENNRHCVDFTGCGNSLNMLHPRTLQLIMDSLRYWVLEMHVDGFRFDLASTLARELYEVDRLGAFFDIIQQDPVLSQVKLVAEPWDIGPGGYQVGNFPAGWGEWNGKYRDCVRRFWKGDGGTMSELATRLAGSSDLYGHNGRLPSASINFVTCHDGFTLRDLVSYNHKHNEANGEDNRDGCNHNMSWNCGAEGPAKEGPVRALRGQQMRNFMATLLLSQGVPMIRSGDELGQTQRGNNNVYCQDNELSWIDWNLDEEARQFLGFVQRIIRFRREQPVLHRRRFFHGRPIRGLNIKDIYWLTPGGHEMTDADWDAGFSKCLGVVLFGQTGEMDEHGDQIVGDNLLILLNADAWTIPFHWPGAVSKLPWLDLVVDTSAGGDPRRIEPKTSYPLAGRSLALFRWPLQPAPDDAKPFLEINARPRTFSPVGGRVRKPGPAGRRSRASNLLPPEHPG